MNSNYKVKLDIDPINNYEKARKDLITALNSFRQLTQEQQQQLAIEIFGAAAVSQVVNIMQTYYSNH